MNSSGKKTAYWLAVALYCLLIYILSAQSHISIPHVRYLFNDKVLHSIEYGGLSFLLYLSITATFKFDYKWKVMASAVFICFLWGITDEFHQSFVPYRDSDIMDLAADVTGATVVQLLIFAFNKIRFHKAKL